ncbi:MAG: hypothetical protein E6J49_01605 [Chloroflexi bacterium]|nr:MAG: hypothetical protein E6J49_01605 [Chloroflexota bacterium]
MTTLAAMLGTWMGIQAVRMTLAMIIWNVAEDNTTYAGQVAAEVFVAGVVGSFLVRLVPLRRQAVWLGALFGLIVVLRQALPGENASPAFAFASWIVWLCWLPAFIRQAGRAGLLRDAATGIILGVAVQIAGEIALHGLDLELIDGPLSVIAALLLAAAFVAALVSVPDGNAPPSGAWGALVVGPYLFLELTLLTGLGRIEVDTRLPQVVAQLAVALAFVVALALAVVPIRRAVRVLIVALGVAALAAGTAYGAATLATIVLAQVGLTIGLVGSFTSGPQRLDGRVHLLSAVGWIVFFALIFVFYSYRDRVDFLWPIAGAIVVLPSLLARETTPPRTLRPALAAAATLLGAIVIAAIPPANAHPAARGGGELVVLTYNVHQGLDYWSVPSAAALVDRIESANADLVGLQEVNRGWDLSAGIDFFSYVRWRLPQYHAAYGRMDTALFGNAILSRYPITDSSYGILPHLSSALNRGYVWATVDAPGGPLTFVTTHFTAYEGFDVEREAQADAFAQFWAKRPRSILAGDFNAHPQDVTITRLLSSGLVDAGAAAGIGSEFTYSSGAPHERIDYVFVSPEIRAVAAQVLAGTASDHRPVLVTLRLP